MTNVPTATVPMPAVHELPPREAELYAACRVLRHAWSEAEWVWPPPSWGIGMAWRCDRCGTTRREVWTILGELSHRHYDYPDGYRWAGSGDARPSAATWRLVWLERHRSGGT